MARRSGILLTLFSLTAALAVPTLASAVSAESKVSVGSPVTPYLPNARQRARAGHGRQPPDVLAAGANDLVDSAPCNGSSCDLTPDIGISGIYFSLNEGATWVQPTYTGLTAQNGTDPGRSHPHPARVLRERHELPRRPGAGVRPPPGRQRDFSWANGSRLYYANLAFPIPGRAPFNGASAAAVSRTDNVAAAAAGVQSAWMDPVIVSRQNAALLSDKEDIWADNAASSPLLRQRLCLQHRLPQRRRPARADRALGLQRRREHLAAAPAHLGDQQRPVGRPPGLRGPHRQHRRGLRRLGGRRRRPERVLPGPLVRRRQQLREAPAGRHRAPTSACSTRCRAASCSTGSPAPAPTASPA